MPSPENAGWKLLLERVSEVLDSSEADRAAEVFAHRIAVARAEAERPGGSLEFFVPTAMWNAKSFDMASRRSVDQARRSRPTANAQREEEQPRRIKSL